MPSCPLCADEMSAPLAVSFTTMRRVERYWCASCTKLHRGSVMRDFEAEDAGLDYSAAILWDLGAIDPGNPFAARAAAA